MKILFPYKIKKKRSSNKIMFYKHIYGNYTLQNFILIKFQYPSLLSNLNSG